MALGVLALSRGDTIRCAADRAVRYRVAGPLGGPRVVAGPATIATVLVATDLVIRAITRGAFAEDRAGFAEGFVHRCGCAGAVAIAQSGHAAGCIRTRISSRYHRTAAAIAAIAFAGTRCGAAVAVV